jgi:hypothetical protein
MSLNETTRLKKENQRVRKERDEYFHELCLLKRELAEEKARSAREVTEERVRNDILKRRVSDLKAMLEQAYSQVVC